MNHGRVAVWQEGSHHPFDETAEWLVGFFRQQGFDARRVGLGEALRGEADLTVLGGLVYSDTPGYTQPADLPARLRDLASRSPLLALHSVIGSWDAIPELDEFWDGRWVWGESTHSPVEPFAVRPEGDHPIVRGLTPFETTDELYYRLREPRKSHVLLRAAYEGREWPLAWTHGRYVYCGLGHDVAALDRPPVRDFLARAARYLVRTK